MSSYFHSNQYEDAFYSHKLCNWEHPKRFSGTKWFNDRYESQKPRKNEGFTQTIVENNGHIRKDVKKPQTNPWGDYVGTWDMPHKIPGNRLDLLTGRRPDYVDKLRRQARESNNVMSGQTKNQTRRGVRPITKDASTSSLGSTKKSVSVAPNFLRANTRQHKKYPKEVFPVVREQDSPVALPPIIENSPADIKPIITKAKAKDKLEVTIISPTPLKPNDEKQKAQQDLATEAQKNVLPQLNPAASFMAAERESVPRMNSPAFLPPLEQGDYLPESELALKMTKSQPSKTQVQINAPNEKPKPKRKVVLVQEPEDGIDMAKE